jgi:hypothetical protein
MKTFTVLFAGVVLAASAANAGDTAKTVTSATAEFESLDKNADQQISKTEAASDKTLADSFASADANGDGYLNKSEYVARTKS